MNLPKKLVMSAQKDNAAKVQQYFKRAIAQKTHDLLENNKMKMAESFIKKDIRSERLPKDKNA